MATSAGMKVELGMMEDQSEKENAGTEGSEAGTGKTEMKVAWVEVLQINLHQCKETCQLFSRKLQKVQT